MKIKTHWLTASCQYCETDFEYYPKRSSGRFCSVKCSGSYHHRVRSKSKFLSGEFLDRSVQKVFVTERDGHKCHECGITEWQGKPIVFDLSHQDGDPSNNDPDNLRLICQNCHGQTDSYGGKNRGNGRKSRGLSPR